MLAYQRVPKSPSPRYGRSGSATKAFIGEMRALDRFAKEKKVVSRERHATATSVSSFSGAR
jgi:hypothetical protein